MYTAKLLRTSRTKKGLSQMTVAKALKLKNSQYVSNLESGRITLPAKYTGTLSRVLGVSQNRIITAAVRDFEDNFRTEAGR